MKKPPGANVAVAEASLQEAEASLKQAEAALKKEMRNLEYTTIKSPVDGVVVKRLVNIGQTVVSSMSASSLFYIATDLSKLKIWAAVNEADIGSIRKGQEVLFTVDAFAGRKFKGTVDKIRLDATMTSNVVTYIVDIDVPNPDKLLIPYLTANVQFVVEDIRNAFLVSNAALRFRPETELVSAEQKAAFDRMQPELAAPRPGRTKEKSRGLGIAGQSSLSPPGHQRGKQRHADSHCGRNAPGRNGNRIYGPDTEPLRQFGERFFRLRRAGKTRSRPKCPRAASLAQAIQKRQPRPETTALPRLPDPGNRHHSTS